MWPGLLAGDRRDPRARGVAGRAARRGAAAAERRRRRDRRRRPRRRLPRAAQPRRAAHRAARARRLPARTSASARAGRGRPASTGCCSRRSTTSATCTSTPATCPRRSPRWRRRRARCPARRARRRCATAATCCSRRGWSGVADATLAEAAAMFAAERLTRDVAECELGRAECALLRGDLEAARSFAASAGRRFRRRGDEAWAVRATLLSLQADAASFAASPTGAARARRGLGSSRRAAVLEELCAATGRRVWQDAASYVRIEADLARGAVPRPGGAARGARPGAQRRPARGAPARASHPRGARDRGRRAGPRRALRPQRASATWRTTARASARSTCGRRARCTGPRSRTSTCSSRCRTSRPAAVLEAAERVRSVIGGSPRVNPPSDPETAALLWDLRKLIDAGRDGAGPAGVRPRARPARARGAAAQARDPRAVVARARAARGRSGRRARPRCGARSSVARAACWSTCSSTAASCWPSASTTTARRCTSSGRQLTSPSRCAACTPTSRCSPTRWCPPDLRPVADRSLDAQPRAASSARLAAALHAPGRARRRRRRLARRAAVVDAAVAGRAGPTVVAPSVHHWMRYAGTRDRPARPTSARPPARACGTPRRRSRRSGGCGRAVRSSSGRRPRSRA